MNKSTFFSRQMILKGFGEEAQQKLFQSKVAVVGVGGLGCPLLMYLAAAGVGHLILIEGDKVEESNLHRQILFTPQDVGQSKCEVAGKKLREAYPYSGIQTYNTYLNRENAADLLSGVDLIIDGTDIQAAKFLVADVGQRLQIPVLYGAIDGFEGQIAIFGNVEANDVSFRDLFSSEDESGLVQTCSENGILGAAAGLIGLEMAVEAIKFLSQMRGNIVGKLRLIDVLSGHRRTIKLGGRKNVENGENNEVSSKKYLVEPEDFYRFCDTSGSIIIDVRTKEEFSLYNIGGLNIPLDELEDRMKEILVDQSYIIICTRGVRSRQAHKILTKNGREKIYVLNYGIFDVF